MMSNIHIINISLSVIYYSCVFGKRNYRVLVRVSVCVCARVCVCVRVCVFLHDNSKRNRSRNTKSEYSVVYENSSDEFDIELHRIKVKVTVGVQKFSPFTTIQTVILWNAAEGSIFWTMDSMSQLWNKS